MTQYFVQSIGGKVDGAETCDTQFATNKFKKADKLNQIWFTIKAGLKDL